VSLGSTTVGGFARVDVHAGEQGWDAWLLGAHAHLRNTHVLQPFGNYVKYHR